MIGLSKLVIATVCVASSVEALKKGKEHKRSFLGVGGALRPLAGALMGLAAVSSSSVEIPEVGVFPQTSRVADLPVESEQFQVQLSDRLRELERLLHDESLMKKAFKNFMDQKYGPAHAADADIAGTDTKYVAFSYNVQLAHERNQGGGGKVIHGITPLMDLTREEFNRMLGYQAPKGHLQGVKPEDVLELQPTTLKDAMDWRSTAVTPIKDQGQCGSCWAFSTVESMESNALVQGLYDISDPFIGSPQELVSCDTNGSDQGCNGGLPSNGFKFFEKKGLEPDSDYPYTSGATQKTGTCKADYDEGVLEVTSTKQLSIFGIGENSDMKDYIMEKGPMSIAVHANSAWQTYTGGIMTNDDCPGDQQVNHAVQAVALDTTGETPFWVIRNSWASTWGENGYIRITYNKNTCNIAADAMGVEVRKVDKKSPTTEVQV